jgi:hypothetical protein
MARSPRCVVPTAGYESGVLARLIAEHGAQTVVAVDISTPPTAHSAVGAAFRWTRYLPNVHVQGTSSVCLCRLGLPASSGRQVAFTTPECEGISPRNAYVDGCPECICSLKRRSARINNKLDAVRVTRLPKSILVRISRTFAYRPPGCTCSIRLCPGSPAPTA